MRLLLAGGGTGGHVSPAIAIAEAMIKDSRDTEVAFVGREGGDENKAITSRLFKLYTLKIKGFPRKLSKDALNSAVLALKSLKAADRIIGDFSPDAVVATGGYVSWPVVKMSLKRGIPTLMHESNVYPGLVTRLLGRKCDTLLLNSDKSLEYLKNVKNYVTVGNPLREDFFKKSRASARASLGIKENEIFVVSFGGSLGSEKINEAVLKLMENYTAKAPHVKHLHAAGVRYFDSIREKHGSLVKGADGCKVTPYIDNMPAVLTAADIVISRSGAMTLSEIARCGCASILIPSPNVADDHQKKNALALADAEAAILITEDSLSSELLEDKIFDVITDKELRHTLSENVKKFYVADSGKKICEEIKKATKKNDTSAQK